MTERLYYSDSYLTRFAAHVVDRDGNRVVLDATAFYPSSGGQPNDLGSVNGVAVMDVNDEDDRIVHVLAGPIDGANAACEIDWTRRFDHMQQHTGQHLLSAVIADLFGIETVSFHLGAVSSTIDLACAGLSKAQINDIEIRANAVIVENHPVSVSTEDGATATGLRKASERSGLLRIVTIDGLDRSACGGTHVRATGEIGALLLRSTEKIRGNVRLEFLCGHRAVRRARKDYDLLEEIARVFSAGADEAPAMVAAQAERLKESDKTRRKLEGEIASLRGRALYEETPAIDGRRLHSRILPSGPLPEDVRVEASAFCGQGNAVFVAVTESPATALLSCSAGSAINAGSVLKRALTEFQGRGGGTALLAQGSFTGDARQFLDRIVRALDLTE